MNVKKVAIIGAGLSGLASAKYALENGLMPFVFEKSKAIGGLWSLESSHIWKGLISNSSFYREMFSDYPWPENSTMFPSAIDINNYLIGYVKKFGLEDYIFLNTKIELIEHQQGENLHTAWKIHSINLDTLEKKSETFDYLIVAAGEHSKPKIPNIENSTSFRGLQMHSSEFQIDDPRLKSKNVALVGCSFSGTEIATYLVGHAKNILNIFKRPYLVSSRLVKYKKDENSYGILPWDMFLFRRSITDESNNLLYEKLNQIEKKLYSELFPEQTNKELSHPALFYDLNCTRKSIRFTLSDYYLPYVNKNKIKPIKTTIKRFESNGILLENMQFYEIDAIIFCTGYEKSINSFLDETFLQKIQYKQSESKETFNLYKCTFHPDIKNMAFVGMSVGLFFAGSELQAKWACQVFSGKIELPSNQTMKKFIEKEESIRRLHLNQQYPYGDHLTLADSIASEMDLLPNFDELKKTDKKLFDLFWDTGMFSTHFLYNVDKELTLKLMNDVKILAEKSYKFEDSSSIKYSDVVKAFRKNYNVYDYLLREDL